MGAAASSTKSGGGRKNFDASSDMKRSEFFAFLNKYGYGARPQREALHTLLQFEGHQITREDFCFMEDFAFSLGARVFGVTTSGGRKVLTAPRKSKENERWFRMEMAVRTRMRLLADEAEKQVVCAAATDSEEEALPEGRRSTSSDDREGEGAGTSTDNAGSLVIRRAMTDTFMASASLRVTPKMVRDGGGLYFSTLHRSRTTHYESPVSSGIAPASAGSSLVPPSSGMAHLSAGVYASPVSSGMAPPAALTVDQKILEATKRYAAVEEDERNGRGTPPESEEEDEDEDEDGSAVQAGGGVVTVSVAAVSFAESVAFSKPSPPKPVEDPTNSTLNNVLSSQHFRNLSFRNHQPYASCLTREEAQELVVSKGGGLDHQDSGTDEELGGYEGTRTLTLREAVGLPP